MTHDTNLRTDNIIQFYDVPSNCTVHVGGPN